MEAQARNESKQTTLQITGMTCAACANRIEKGLNKLQGVSSANVNFALEKASVTYDPGRVGVDQCHHGKEEELLFPALETIGVSYNGRTNFV